MKIQNLPLTLLKVENKSGVGKTSGKAYDFFVATLIDEDSDVFKFNISDDLASSKGKDSLLDLRNVPISAQVNFKPKGFDVAGTLVDFDEVD